MITSIEGCLVEASPLSAILEVHGLGYEVNIPVTTAEKLPGLGNSVKLYTLVVYREDSQTLYGFSNKEDRDFFRLLVEKVSGIGPKIALNIMSRMSVAMLKDAIVNGDTPLLSKCPGIGKKTAERLVIELRDKVFPGGVSAGAPLQHTGLPGVTQEQSQVQDAVSALVTLGYKAAEADKAIKRAQSELGPEASMEAMIKFALSA